jgi:urea transport system substrate-binding protein
MKRLAVGLTLLVVIGALLVARRAGLLERVVPIRVGLLHSETGDMANSEKSLIDAEVLALEEINARGGLLGRRVEWVVADGQSDRLTFAREATRLIEAEKVSVIFGCWTSASRKSVKPIVEKHNHLLFYPNAYEGLEQSPNIVYTGAAPNQHIIPAVKWSYDNLKARKYFLAGSDHIWSRGVYATVNDCLRALGAEVVGEEYLLLGTSDVEPLIDKIKLARPDIILSTVTGDTNWPFYKKLMAAGLGPQKVPLVAFGVAEQELLSFPIGDMVGDYAAWTYFQSLDRAENQELVSKFKAKYGSERVTSDAIAMAYSSVQLWAQTVEEAQTDDSVTVRKLIVHQSLNAPGGIISIDPETQHTWRPVHIGQIRADGQFDITWSSEKPVRPIPYPNSRTREEWDLFLDELFERWGSNWANPAREKSPIAVSGR